MAAGITPRARAYVCHMDICEQYGTCRSGLNAAEAARRLELYGRNEQVRRKPRPFALRVLMQLKDAMLIVLMAAAIVSLVMAAFDFSWVALLEPLLIFFIVFANALISSFQERKAEKSLAALEGMTAAKCKVRRDGKDFVTDAALLVPGDLITLHAGDIVPADCVLISARALSSDESLLTGESVPVHKRVGDRAYSGCPVGTGSGTAIVTKTGIGTEMGRIATLLDTRAQPLTPLQEKLRKLSEQLGLLSLGICLLVFAIGLLGIYVFHAEGLTSMTLFMTAVALAVSALPEGLPTTVTLVLSAGTRRMVERRAIVRKLPAVEALGSVSVICTDKTGTLTTGRMTVTEVRDYAGADAIALAAVCSDNATDPTDAAVLAAKGAERAAGWTRLAVMPFDNTRRMMSVSASAGGRRVDIVKGALESVSALCGRTDARAERDAEAMAARGLRVIAVASGDSNGMTLAGLIGLSDPPRPEARAAIARCRSAGIRPVMLTGDGPGAARATAAALGLDADKVVTGRELNGMSDAELAARLRNVSVFARVTPSDKLRIVEAFRAAGEVVGVTGDGVNDAPALRAADIGCAMGSGTDVAKAEADIVLTDNDFSTIVDAVETGRGIFDNIRRAVAFLLGTNIGEVVAVFAAMCIGFDSPLMSMQLLWINLISDSFPAIALGREHTAPDVMERKPLGRSEGIFTRGVLVRMLLHGVLFGAICLTAFYIVLNAMGDASQARTAAFLSLSLSQTLHAYNMRSHRPLFTIRPLSNRALNLATLLSFALIVPVISIPPVAAIFSMAIMPAWAYALGIALAFLPLIADEAVKIALYLRGKRGARPVAA